jgi:hypothetical protein
MSRVTGFLLACLLAAGSLALSSAPAAADDGLSITSQAVYEIRPDERLAVVTVNLAVTNLTPDTATHRTVFTGVSIPIPIGASLVNASISGRSLPVSIIPVDEFTELADVTFGTELFYRQTYRFALSFVIADAGGDPERETWIRSSFVGLPIWAYGSPGAGGATVEVTMPAGYQVTVPYGEMEVIRDAGTTRVVAEPSDPATFNAYVSAERSGTRAYERLTIDFGKGPASVLLHAWPDDPDWTKRLSRVLTAGLPELEEAIGIAYPIIGVLNVSEHAYQHLGDYSGVFLEGDDTIEMRFDADAFTALHEGAHVWFNSGIAQERWLLEGFASYYAEQVGVILGEELTTNELTDGVREAAFPLEDWGEVGAEDAGREDYGYAASHELARKIAELAGADGLRAVWQAADTGRLAYADDPSERAARGDPAADDWQRFLDLLENKTDADYDPLWREWVLTDRQAQELAGREVAREAYSATREAAGEWRLPRSTRLLMETWDFSEARSELAAIDDLLEEQASLALRLDGLALQPTNAIGELLGSEGLDAAAGELAQQTVSIAALESATAALSGERQFVEEIGLLGQADPDTDLGRARAFFESGDHLAAAQQAQDAESADAAAAGQGRGRVAIVGGGILLLDLLGMAVLAIRRRRQPKLTVAA